MCISLNCFFGKHIEEHACEKTEAENCENSQQICDEGGSEATENIKKINRVSAIHIHTEIVGVEKNVEKDAECHRREHKDGCFEQIFKREGNFVRKQKIEAVKRHNQMARGLSYVNKFCILHIVEKVFVFRAYEHRKKHTEAKKGDSRVGKRFHSIIENKR